MPRFALGVEYDGTDFVGWQSQRDVRSVQDVLSAAIARVADESVVVHGAGRTDAGVHASGQVAHFDCAATRTPRQWVLGVNSNLPPDVAVQWAAEVPSDFDARRSALSRTYRYRIVTQPTRPALTRRRAWWLRDALDCGAMSAAAVHWLGERDFSSFRAANCQSSTPMRRLDAVRIARDDAERDDAERDGTARDGTARRAAEVEIDFRANAFLYHMVRNLVGTLVEIGAGRAPPEWAREVLAGRDRTRAAMTAPACGLTLLEVAYPEALGLPHGSRDVA